MALGANKAALLGAAGASSTSSAFTIDQSIRFNNSDSAYLTKTFGGSASNRRTHTYSFWLKLGANAAGSDASGGCFFLSTNDSGASAGDYFHLNGDLKLRYWSNESSASTFETNQLFRDFSAWYHIVLVNDRDNAVGSEAVRLYVNGQRVTSFAVNNISGRKSQDTMVNASSFLWMIQRFTSGTVHGDAYMAEIVFLDGTATDCNSFGEFNSSGIWIPKDVSGLTFGTNGFHIDGRDSSDLGDDESGQGNDFTTSGLAAHDQVFDTPTNNFCVLNPLSKPSYDSGVTYRGVSGVNLSNISKPSGNTNGFAFGTMGVTSGKWYYELYTTTYPAVEALGIGWIDSENTQTATASGSGWRDFGINQRHTTSAYSSWFWGSNESTNTGLTPFQASVVVGVATDFDNNTFTLTTNGSAYGSVDFDSTSPTQDLTDGTVWLPRSDLANDAVALVTFNFGQDSTFNGQITAGGNADGNGVGNFKYSVPSGYLALCTKNVGS